MTKVKFNCILLFIIFPFLTSYTKTKTFPAINYKTIEGKTINNDFFKEKKTLVIMAHLGCPPAMMLFRDLETLTTDKFQVLIILENTKEQINNFNALVKNDWSGIRNHFKLKPIMNNVIAECETSSIKKSGEDLIIGTQCRKLSRKIKTKSSPTLVFVNETGEISKVIKGYFGDKDQSDRLRKLNASF